MQLYKASVDMSLAIWDDMYFCQIEKHASV